MPAEITKQNAIKALDRMAMIVKNEMLQRGSYVDPQQDESKKNQVCQGHKMCAVGSLFVAGGAGIPAVMNGSWPNNREEFLKPRHALRLAYESLNEAAYEYAQRHKFSLPTVTKHRIHHHPGNVYSGALETLFETKWEGSHARNQDMLQIIKNAKRKVASA